MASGKVRNLEEGFTSIEEAIVKAFLEGKSIRELSSKPIIEGNKETKFGRTAIKNLLIDYKRAYPELADKIDERLFSNKNHKKPSNEPIREISQEEIADIYEQIMRDEKTLTQVACEKGRTRDYIKRKVHTYLNDKEKRKEFNKKLKSNQTSTDTAELLDNFLELSDEAKKQIIFEKLNLRAEKTGKSPYNEAMINRKLERLKKYFLVTRNSKFEEQVITAEEFWKMLYDTPSLLAYSLSDKVDPAMRNLDKNEHIGPERATQIIVEDASILGSSISRTNLQIQILVDYGLLKKFLQKPRYFRTSPELIYGLIKFHEANEEKTSEEVFLTEKQLNDKYGVSPNNLKERYDAKEEYGDYEYFDK